jgi:phage shock protein A
MSPRGYSGRKDADDRRLHFFEEIPEMNTLRWWTSSIVSSFEAVVGQIENHEALVSSAIEEAEKSSARAKVQLTRVRRDGQAMRQRLVELRDEECRWDERARKTASLDEKRALECLRRKKRVVKQIADLEVQEREHAKLEKQLGDDLSTVEQKLTALRQQRNVMRTRQSRAEALKLIHNVDSGAVSEIDQIFDRWEARITACEMNAAATSPSDSLDDEYRSSEEEEELKRELRELTESPTTDTK